MGTLTQLTLCSDFACSGPRDNLIIKKKLRGGMEKHNRTRGGQRSTPGGQRNTHRGEQRNAQWDVLRNTPGEEGGGMYNGETEKYTRGQGAEKRTGEGGMEKRTTLKNAHTCTHTDRQKEAQTCLNMQGS